MNQAKKRLVLAVTLGEQGGVQAFLLGFAKWLKTKGHDVTMVAGDGDWLFDRAKQAGIETRRIASLGREIDPLRDGKAYAEIKRAFRELRPDAVHLNSAKMGVLGSMAARHLRIPRITYRIGGWTFLEPLSPLRKWLYESAERWSAPCKDIIICVHPGDAEAAQQRAIRPKQKILVVPNGIDLATFDAAAKSREQARRDLGLDGNLFVFGTVANFYPAKDLPRYMEACALVQRSDPETRFVLIGDGNGRAAIEQSRDRLGLGKSVVLAGAKDDAGTLLRAFDAFVLPSAKEGMPWSLLEAMASGLPCIATDVGANRWMLGPDAGWIVPPKNTDALAAAMQEVKRNPDEATRRGHQARMAVETRFPLERTYEQNADALLT